MTTNNTTSPENLYNIAPEGKARLYTAAEIKAAAAGRRLPRQPRRDRRQLTQPPAMNRQPKKPNQHRQDGTKTAPAVLILCPCGFLTMPPEI